MKILVDENMPYARELFSRTGEVIAVPGRPIPAAALDDADALMVRSVTKVNEALLGGKAIKFVGTATAGTDHIDEDFLARQGIGFSAAPGCNAIAVVEYVFSALLMLAERDGFQLTDRTVGIVGVGNVGGRLQKRLEALGVKTLLCDPPRADRGDAGDFLPLETVAAQADVLTFHTPLFKAGRYQTLHMADEALLRALKPNAIVINACRGPVVDNAALLRVLQQRDDLSVVLDVWEPEPDLNVELLARVDIGTAHIAGYTLEGKARGTTQVFEAWTRFLGQAQQVSLETLLPAPEFGRITLHGPLDQATLKRLAHLVYDVRRDDAPLRKVAGQPGEFDRLRKQYQERREWSSLYVQCDDAAAAALLSKLGFNAVHQPA
ncbi:MAG: 4-phosphoerythronate dehydrogenase PdxB [Mixta calida]|uniref:Erythronate-4-phosphate dehydrogenase n=1 Tax=Mixta calida TaxID=665913 RepID=A0ABN5HCZ5_9GAMM|nr:MULTISPECIES: 4-phosphoerythronate dehydrogenase PdxB [Mixta]AIX73035.1 erythronate-4-phosphate dehydrogenase [Pantoea sp. PSNIH2]MBS6056921.1 4-phosphoerythronate dehydrogenase PdxB [Pantoea sp.]POU46394.1 4-phosphoerythronate dehydrogenase PdxB [Pantoea sp. PSNIH5]POU64290.1 4-phosphoerythronate dehydrogenase PdxB [Pantoea sp. PSNIH4]POY67485.1 4-phosphoerythronate dehydrogenase PdxB [Pantoea sp. PSNIH3]